MLILKNIEQIKDKLGLKPNGKTQKVFTETCAKAMDKYVPFDKGDLADYYLLDDGVVYHQPYARYQYHGISKSGKKMNYHTDKHELAGPYWDKRMVSAEIDKVITQTQNYMEGKR